MRMLLVILSLLGGCSSSSKHETLSLQCLGLCAFTNVNHETTKENQDAKASPVPADRN